MKIEKYFYGVCALCLLLSCQQVAKQVDTPVLPTKPFEMGEVVITKGKSGSSRTDIGALFISLCHVLCNFGR